MPLNRIRKEDLADLDFTDGYELRSDGYGPNSIYLNTTLVSTTAGSKTVIINLPSDGEGIFYGFDHPAEADDIVWLFGTSGADGYYTINTVLDDTTFIVNENILSSTDGYIQFRYPSGASKVGVNSTNLSYSNHNDAQKVFEDLDGYVMPKPTEVGQLLYAVESSNLNFIPAKPIINDDGLIIVNEDDIIVVVT